MKKGAQNKIGKTRNSLKLGSTSWSINGENKPLLIDGPRWESEQNW
jgi:hypothetical protein